MTKVCVCCKKQPVPYDNTRSFHKFPNDMNRLKEWMKITGVKKITKNSTVCSDHFDASAFHHTDGYTVVRRLLSTAVPITKKHDTYVCSMDEDTSNRNVECKSIITINTNEVDGHISVQSANTPNINNINEENLKIEDTSIPNVPVYSYNTDDERNRKKLKITQKPYIQKSIRFKEGMQSHTISREDFASDTAWKKFFIYTKYKNSQVNAARQKSWRRNKKVGETEFVRCLEDDYGATDNQIPIEQENNVSEGKENELEECNQEVMLNTECDFKILDEVDKICRICMSTDVKLWNLVEHNLVEHYQNLTELAVS